MNPNNGANNNLQQPVPLRGLIPGRPGAPPLAPNASLEALARGFQGSNREMEVDERSESSSSGVRLPAETSLTPIRDDIAEHNRIFAESVNRGAAAYEMAIGERELPTINMREDVGLDDPDLANISTKDLNKLLKKKGISKARQKEIKRERRTLKNRGYAANCRVKRLDEMEELQQDIQNLDEEYAKEFQEVLRKEQFLLDYQAEDEKQNEIIKRMARKHRLPEPDLTDFDCDDVENTYFFKIVDQKLREQEERKRRKLA